MLLDIYVKPYLKLSIICWYPGCWYPALLRCTYESCTAVQALDQWITYINGLSKGDWFLVRSGGEMVLILKRFLFWMGCTSYEIGRRLVAWGIPGAIFIAGGLLYTVLEGWLTCSHELCTGNMKAAVFGWVPQCTIISTVLFNIRMKTLVSRKPQIDIISVSVTSNPAFMAGIECFT